MKAVFDSKPSSVYNDDELRYHFPAQYLSVIQKTVGDWVVFREPRDGGGSMAYFAVARVTGIDPDPSLANHYYALLEDYLQFDRSVPWLLNGRYSESALRALENRSLVGAHMRGRSARKLEDSDFIAIVRYGLQHSFEDWDDSKDRRDQIGNRSGMLGFEEGPPETIERRVVEMLSNRKVRDSNFRRQVCDAYDNRCAVTRLKIINGGGKAEVQAAHVLPVKFGGPDIIQNGIALSSTAHWLFDRHLISLTKNYGLLVSHNKVPAEFRGLLHGQEELVHLPKDRNLWPHPRYLDKHRDRFAGNA